MTGARCVVALAALALAACSSVDAVQQMAPEFAALRAAGLRIAVMPFTLSAPADGLLTTSLAPLGDVIALEPAGSGSPTRAAAELVRQQIIAWLQQSDFEVVDPWFADTRLTHAEIADAARRAPDNAPRLAAVIDCDAVLFGDVTRWNRSYYVLQSNAEVALHLDLRDRSGRPLFTTDRTESIGAGLSGGPTGYVSAATEPIAGLRGVHLLALTRSVARHAAADLNGGDLGAVPNPNAPRLSVVALAKMHAGPFRAGERLEVVAIGTPGCAVRFDVGRLRMEVPMAQTTIDSDPRGDRATYRGHYVVQPGDAAEELPLRCTIQRGAARRSVAYRYPWQGTVSLAGNAR